VWRETKPKPSKTELPVAIAHGTAAARLPDTKLMFDRILLHTQPRLGGGHELSEVTSGHRWVKALPAR
jgi:hypothetical protein